MQRRPSRNGDAIAAAAIMALTLLATSVSAGDEADRELAPDWTLPGVEGAPLNFYQHSADRPAVILFWATWCPYCRQLMPHLEKLRQEFVSDGVNFYALDIWEDGDPVAYMKENGYGFQLLLNADEVAKTYGVKGTPGLFVVDANRAVLYVRKPGGSPTRVESDVRFVLGNLKK
jgi:thiol-disulfide isomerase/thioredoxin